MDNFNESALVRGVHPRSMQLKRADASDAFDSYYSGMQYDLASFQRSLGCRWNPASTSYRPTATPGVRAMCAAAVQENGTGKAVSAGSFIRPHLRDLAPYTPIEPFEVLSAKLGRLPQDIIKLDANENPYGPPPEVRQALAAMPFPHIYPDPGSRRLRQALAEMSGVPAEHLLVSSLYF